MAVPSRGRYLPWEREGDRRGRDSAVRQTWALNPSSAPHWLHHPRPVTLPPPEWRLESLLCTLVGSAQNTPSLLWGGSSLVFGSPILLQGDPHSLATTTPPPPAPVLSGPCLYRPHPPAFPILCPSSSGLRLPSMAPSLQRGSNSLNFHGNSWVVSVLSSPFYRWKILRHGGVKSLAQGHTISRR